MGWFLHIGCNGKLPLFQVPKSRIVCSSVDQLTTIIGAGFITAEVLNGLGRHEYYLTPSQKRNFQAVGWADWIQVFITLCLTKVSICLFLLRIVDSRKVVRGMYVLIGFMVLFSSIFIFLFIGICRPLKAYWDVGVNGWCFSNPQVESIVIAQGGMTPALSSNAALLTFSLQSCPLSQI